MNFDEVTGEELIFVEGDEMTRREYEDYLVLKYLEGSHCKLSSGVCAVDDPNQEWPSFDVPWTYLQLGYRAWTFLFQKEGGPPLKEISIEAEHAPSVSLIQNGFLDLEKLKQYCAYDSVNCIWGLKSPWKTRAKHLSLIERNMRNKLSLPVYLDIVGQQLFIVEPGAVCPIPPRTSPEDIGTVFVNLQGIGEYRIHSRKDTLVLQRNRWIATFGDNRLESLPVTWGEHVVLICSIRLTTDRAPPRNQKDCQYNSLNSFLNGPTDEDLQKTFLKKFCSLMEGKHFGILGGDPVDIFRVSPDTLLGPDKVLLDMLKEYGSTVQLQPTIYLRTSSDTYGRQLPKESNVYAFIRETCLAQQKDSEFEETHLIPFLDTRTCQISHKEVTKDNFIVRQNGKQAFDDKFPTTLISATFMIAALIVYVPMWSRVRLLWVAKEKNCPLECLLASLPRELIAHIASLASRQPPETRVTISRKRKVAEI